MKRALNRKPCRRQRFSLRPLEFEGFGEWTDRERDATKKGMDSLRKAMDAFRRGAISLTVKPEVPRVTNQRAAPPSPEELAKAFDATDWKELGEGTIEEEGA